MDFSPETEKQGSQGQTERVLVLLEEGSRVVPSGQTDGRTDGHDEANSRFSQICERAYQNRLLNTTYCLSTVYTVKHRFPSSNAAASITSIITPIRMSPYKRNSFRDTRFTRL